jgi:hypothetical protein
MSDVSTPAPRPVSFATILVVFISFAIFALAARSIYSHHMSQAPQNEVPENLSKDMAWRATPEDRRKYLADLKEKQQAQANSYAWVDQKAGIVQVPIERAEELVIQDNAAK